jgi:hypothetical protein
MIDFPAPVSPVTAVKPEAIFTLELLHKRQVFIRNKLRTVGIRAI